MNNYRYHNGLREEKMVAERLSMNEVLYLKIYDKLKEAVKRIFTCPVFEDKRSFEDYLECIDSNFFKHCSFLILLKLLIKHYLMMKYNH